MRVYCHLPTSIPRPDDLSNAQFDLLQQVILRAVRRAVSGLELADVRIEIVPERQPSKRKQQTPLATRADGEMDTRTMPDEIQSGREEEQALMTVLPSPETVGAIVVMDGTAAGSTTGRGDTLISEQFPWVPVVERASDSVIYAGGAPYVRTGYLARAMNWGEQLFSDSGFAILQSQTASSAGDFNVVSLLPSADSGNGLMMGEEEGNDVTSEAVLLHPEGYSTVTVAQSEGTQIFGSAGRDLWDVALFNEVMNTSTPEQDQVDQSTMPQEDIFSGRAGIESQRRVAQQQGLPLTQGGMAGPPSGYVDEEMIDLIASMERTAFAAMPAEKRRECLSLMIDAWNGERDEQTIIEILHAARDASELRMLLALLSRAGLYEQLFGRLTQGVYELLEQIGASQAEQILDWQYLVDALLALGIELPEPGSRLALVELQQAAAAFAHLVEQVSSELQHIVTTSGLADDVQGLAAFFWMVQQAQADDPGAQTLLTRLVGEACTLPVQAIRGLDDIEQLSGSYRRETVEPERAKTVKRSLFIASVVVVVQQFIKSDLVRDAMRAGSTFSEQLHWLAAAMRV